MRNILLLGQKGTGKTTIAKILKKNTPTKYYLSEKNLEN